MKIGLTWKIIVCGLLCVFTVDIKGKACQCTNENGGKCKSCNVGCYLRSDGHCYNCRQNCDSCADYFNCHVCKPGLYGPICDHDCISCSNGSCTNNTCTDGCADGHYYNRYCRPCLKTCVTCNSYSECTVCIAGRTGSYCGDCTDDYKYYNGQCIPCNTNCLHGKCYEYTGECTYGCNNGWSGRKCQDECAPTCSSCQRYRKATCNFCPFDQYGTSCEHGCSSNCVAKDGRQCKQIGGNCLDDCVTGFKGYKCDVPCSAGCYSGCDRYTGVCDGRAVIGGAVGSAVVIVLIIVTVLVFIFVKRRRPNEADPERSVTYENSPIDNGPWNVSVTDSDRITESSAHHTTLTLSLGPVTNMEAHYTTLTPSLGPVYEELDINDEVGYEDIKDYEVPTTSNYYYK